MDPEGRVREYRTTRKDQALAFPSPWSSTPAPESYPLLCFSVTRFFFVMQRTRLSDATFFG